MPADTLVVLCFVAEAEDLHPVVVERVWLCEVEDVEFYRFAFSGVTDLEEVPLSVAVRVDVVLQNQVVFCITYFNRSQKIARFESRLKDKGFIALIL